MIRIRKTAIGKMNSQNLQKLLGIILVCVILGYIIWWFIKKPVDVAPTKDNEENPATTPTPNATIPTPKVTAKGQTVRFLRLARTTGSESIKENALEVYQGSHPYTHIYYMIYYVYVPNVSLLSTESHHHLLNKIHGRI